MLVYIPRFRAKIERFLVSEDPKTNPKANARGLYCSQLVGPQVPWDREVCI